MDSLKDEQVIEKFIDDFERFSSGKQAKRSKVRCTKDELMYLIFKLKKRELRSHERKNYLVFLESLSYYELQNMYQNIRSINSKKLSDTSFHMHIETTGSISAKDALLKAIQILKEDLISYKKLL